MTAKKPFYRSRTLIALIAVIAAGAWSFIGGEQERLAEVMQIAAALVAAYYRVVATHTLES